MLKACVMMYDIQFYIMLFLNQIEGMPTFVAIEILFSFSEILQVLLKLAKYFIGCSFLLKLFCFNYIGCF